MASCTPSPGSSAAVRLTPPAVSGAPPDVCIPCVTENTSFCIGELLVNEGWLPTFCRVYRNRTTEPAAQRCMAATYGLIDNATDAVNATLLKDLINRAGFSVRIKNLYLTLVPECKLYQKCTDDFCRK